MRYYEYVSPQDIDTQPRKANKMGNMVIKEVSEFFVIDENNNRIRKSKLVISENGVDTEIILEGKGKVRVTTKV